MSSQEPSQNLSTPPSKTDGGKPPVSEHKIDANRRNALRSTGPKTKRGKSTVSRNAIKHGLFARQVVIETGFGAEKPEEFNALVEQLREHFKPEGPIEESLVETIACCLWRKARIIRAENGEIRKHLDSAELDFKLRSSDKANLELALAKLDASLLSTESGKNILRLKERWSSIQVSQLNLRDHPVGVAYLSSILSIARSEIVSTGSISQSIREQIFAGFCFWDYLFAILIANESKESTMVDPTTGMAVFVKAEENPIDPLVLVDEMLVKLSIYRKGAAAGIHLAADAEARSFSLPSADATDKIIRYETHLDRQMYRAMDQLERLQRQRKGENVPPPLNLNLDRRA